MGGWLPGIRGSTSTLVMWVLGGRRLFSSNCPPPSPRLQGPQKPMGTMIPDKGSWAWILALQWGNKGSSVWAGIDVYQTDS